jgi:hypothetical protein
LVYDPEKSKKVTNAHQLFGQWSLGGGRLASLGSEGMPAGAAAPPWAHGYEALATMDLNGDGQVSGEELEPLALWFDENRDGVSQDGEVRSLASASITALFYEPSRRDPNTGDVYAARGFERVLNGKRTIGASVDWFGEGAESATELVSKLMGEGILCDNALPPELGFASETVGQTSISASSALPNKSIAGAWSWKASGDNLPVVSDAKGFFTFKEGKENEFTGHSIFEIAFAQTWDGAESAVHILPLTGKEELDDAGNILTVRFHLPYQDGIKVESQATLSKDGSTLSGSTKTDLVRKGKPMTLRYTWTAKRMAPETHSQ